MKMRKSDKLPLLIAYLSVFAITARAQSFKCSGSTTKCQALAGYISPNKTTLADIQTMFGVVRLEPLLGANSLPLNTTSEYSVAAGETIKIPFPCTCDNGTGVSDRVPVYKIKKNDGLYHIAAEVFSGLVQYPQIAAVNNISNVDLIKEGDELRIPLPCSCDNVDGLQVVHYAHVVAKGSSVEQIAQKFGTSNTTLLSLNGITNPNDLKAGQVLDVPLRACSSKVRNDSLDYPLSVANGTYTLTANNCVQCKCDSSNNFTLQCESSSSKEIKVYGWSQCPAMQCSGLNNLTLGNATVNSSCGRTVCAYAGYTNATIFTVLDLENTCSSSSPSGNFASKISSEGSTWRLILISLHMSLLCFGFVW